MTQTTGYEGVYEVMRPIPLQPTIQTGEVRRESELPDYESHERSGEIRLIGWVRRTTQNA
jgi:hypothetical protein